MNRIPSLYQELLSEKNRYFDDNDSFELVTIFTNLLFSVMIVLLIVGAFITILDNIPTLALPFSMNDYVSICLGNTAFFFSFKLIKKRIIPFYASNPIMIIGIIYPAFFNATLIQSFMNINPIVNIAVLILSMISYYFILNRYYQKTYYKERF